MTDAEIRAADDELIIKLYGQIFDLKASLGVLTKLMEDDIDSGRVRATIVRTSLLADARNLAKYETPIGRP